MSSSSSSSTISATTYSRPLLARRSSIEISIEGHYTSKVYTSGSPVSGEVIITPSRDVRFDTIQIILIGTTRTRLDALQIPTQASHIFLKLSMPMPDSAYPAPRVFEAGESYRVPFNFVIPGYLTMSACNHHAVSDIIHDYHMRLPPTVGSWEKDDMAPDMAKVEYAVKARVFGQPDLDGRPVKLMEASHQLKVLPAFAEEPPLSITKHDKRYAMSKSKSLRKNLWSGKLGKITATAAQPAAVMLSADGRRSTGTSALVNLKFVPASTDVTAPKISTISAKLSATTYYSANPVTKLPNLGSGKYDYSNDQCLNYQTSVNLFSTSVDSVTWQQQMNPQARRDSGYSSGHSDRESARTPKSREAPLFYTASLAIPVDLPSKKMFLPTFHSCLMSRVYALNLTLSVGSTNTSVNLALPLQVAVESSVPELNLGLPSFESVMAAEEEAEADEYLRPRLLQVPAPELQGNSILPGYADLGYRS